MTSSFSAHERERWRIVKQLHIEVSGSVILRKKEEPFFQQERKIESKNH